MIICFIHAKQNKNYEINRKTIYVINSESIAKLRSLSTATPIAI